MANELRDYAGAAVITTISADITSGSLSIGIASSTGWPSGGANGPFFVVIDKGTASEEKVEVASRTGTTLTVASSGKRGIDGTVAASHTAGSSIQHCFTAQDADEFNSHAFNTTLDQHTQYMKADGTRHDLNARHQFGAALGTPGAASALLPNQSAAAGVGTVPSRSDHAHGIATTAASTITGSNAEGTSFGFARADHNHQIGGTNHIPGAALVNDSITATQIAPDAIGASELANGSVAQTADIVDGIVTLAKMASEATTDFTSSITFDNVTLGAGGTKYARYFKLGRLVILFYGFQLGTGGDVTGKIAFNLPFTAADLTGGIGNSGGIVVGRAVNPGVFSGLGAILIATNKATDIITAGGSVSDTWDNDTPHDWQAGSVLQGLVLYVATS